VSRAPLNPLPPTDAVQKQKKNILKDILCSVLLQFKKIHLSRNQKCINLGVIQILKFHILMGKILPISLKLIFTPNTLGCYGLKVR